MNLFTKYVEKEPTEESINIAARNLIMDQLKESYPGYPIYGIISAPAKKYAQEVLNEQIKSLEIEKKIDNFLQGELLEGIIANHIHRELRSILKEELIEEIVSKINKQQLRKK